VGLFFIIDFYLTLDKSFYTYMFKNQKLIIILVCIFSTQSCSLLDFWKFRQHEIRESYYNNGSLEYKSSYFNDKLDGPTYYYDINGVLITYAEYSNGSLNGISKSFYPSGKIKYSCTYFYGHKHGEEKFYHNNGKEQSLVKYDYGVQVDDIIRWNEKGELIY
tara:strand:+ start:124 stop:609 length:486 start_codon:yes stop_codon:yes gene_type:complete